MRPLLFLCFFFLFSSNISAQENNDFTELFKNAKTVLYNQPQECLKITGHLIQNSENPRQQIQVHLLDAGANYAIGEFDLATKSIIEAKKIADITDDKEMQIKISISSIHILNHLGLNVVAEQYYINTKVFADETNNVEIPLYLDGGIALIDAYKYKDQNKLSEALNNLEKANALFKKTSNQILINETTAALAEIYLKAANTDSLKNYPQSIVNRTNSEHSNNFLKMIVQNQLGKFYFLKKDYPKSLASYQTALEIAEQLNNKPYSSEIMDGLSTTYLALDDTAHFNSFRIESDQLANEVENEEEIAVNSIYNYINDNNTLKRNIIKETYQRNLLILSSILVLILLTWVALRFRYRNRAKQYERFISYFENIQKPKEIVPAKEIPKSLNIPKETENALVQKLSQFENSKQFTKQDMSLAMLASHFDTNTKYLSEIINTHKDKNFNSYINELRINYIIDKLKNNSTYSQYKISYLAEESGFSSHSSFATVFKAVTGIPPTVFIDMLNTTKKSHQKQI
ncbi:MAG: helix-turn-helix domain-containing protein [Aequorivita sp.]|nr:helix-turn-helix domain-containing protein [Aequorivita sp.]